MFQMRDKDLIALGKCLAESMGHSVDGIRTAFGENDLSGFTGVEENPRFFPRLLKGFGRTLTHLMNAAVDIAVAVVVVLCFRIDHLKRLLAACSIVKINERLSVDLLTEDGKLFS